MQICLKVSYLDIYTLDYASESLLKLQKYIQQPCNLTSKQINKNLNKYKIGT